MYYSNIQEKITFQYKIENKDLAPFTENIHNDLDITYGSMDEKIVRIINHFFRFLGSIGFEIDDIIEAIDAVVEAYELIDNEDEESTMEKRFSTEDNSEIEEMKEKELESFDKFEAEVITSSNFRNYLYSLFKEENE